MMDDFVADRMSAWVEFVNWNATQISNSFIEPQNSHSVW